MPYGTPADPVGGTVITVAYAVSNLLDPIRWLRLMTGNADPPGSSYVVVSTSTAATSWQKVPGDALAAGAALTNLNAAASNTATNTWTFAQAASLIAAGDISVAGQIVSTRATGVPPLIVASTDRVVNLNADKVDGREPGVLVGSIAYYDDVTGKTIYSVRADMLVNRAAGTAAGDIAFFADTTGDLTVPGDLTTNGNFVVAGTGYVEIDNGVLYLNAARDHYLQWNGTAYVIGGNLDIVTSGGRTFIHSANIGIQTVANFSGSLAGDVTGTQGATVVANKVPTGAIVMFRLNSDIPAGWTRETALDGRIPVGDGTTFSQTFAQATNYGANWTPSSGLGAANNVTATSGAVAATAMNDHAAGAGTGVAGNTHTHPAPTITVGGTVDLTGTTTAWLPPMRAYVFARKN